MVSAAPVSGGEPRWASSYALHHPEQEGRMQMGEGWTTSGDPPRQVRLGCDPRTRLCQLWRLLP